MSTGKMTRAERTEARAKVAECQSTIRDAKRGVATDLVAYKQAAKELRKVAIVFNKASKAYDRRPNGKNEVKYNAAKAELLRCVKAYNEVAKNINAGIDAIHDNYEAIKSAMTGLNTKKAAAAAAEFDKYNKKTTAKIDKIQSQLANIDLPEIEEEEEPVEEIAEELPVLEEIEEPVEEPVEVFEEEEEEAEEEEEPAPAPQPQPQPQQPPYINNFYPPMYPQYAQPAPAPSYIPYPFPVPSFTQPAPAPEKEAPAPKVAPVTIDVSNIVDKAVSATMQKFTSVLEKKIEEYVASIKLPDPVVVPTVVEAPVMPVNSNEPIVVSKTRGAEEIAALEEHILEDEQFVIDKLTAMLEKVQELAQSMATASEKYHEIAAKQSATNDLQKQTNDMQRHTYREQQGIQVSQRVVGQDQAAVASDQIILAEEQKAMVERQAAVNESQLAVVDTQAVVIETQAALDEAMKSVMQAQKEIIRTQQSIINGNNKNVNANAELVAKQTEVLALQKDAIASQKQVLREQKALTRDDSRKKKDSKPVVEEAVVEEVPAPVSEEPVVEETPVEAPVAETATDVAE